MRAIDYQIQLQKEMQAYGLNLIHCNDCDTILIHSKDDEEIRCPSCLNNQHINDCQDLYYEGCWSPDEANEISLIDLFKGEFVNDGSEYQICDYVVSSYNNDDGFCVLVIKDFEGVILDEYSGVGMISEDDDYETRDNFEKTIISLLKGSDLI